MVTQEKRRSLESRAETQEEISSPESEVWSEGTEGNKKSGKEIADGVKVSDRDREEMSTLNKQV